MKKILFLVFLLCATVWVAIAGKPSRKDIPYPPPSEEPPILVKK